ncbi:Myb/SANT-like DNA-binding domain protein [Senna tora]|uniref:Myb/SANT-like DNA-binding domain protein n=1 Tax=Senna tora TaxID=362788 RepID=A0A834TA57_9FABA|nr:Myb/SANT-like DNA-binding domain protein [Senna tora]
MREPSEAKPKTTRRQLTATEDEKLVECLLDLAADKNWKTDNGFKLGFARQLEKRLHEKLHGCDLRASPHIESRVKSHPDANGLYNKTFPHYKDLDKVYGKDRATGEIGEDPVEFVEAMEKEFQEQEIDHIDELQMRNDPFYGLDELFLGDHSPLTPTSGQSVAQDNNGNGEGNIRKELELLMTVQNAPPLVTSSEVEDFELRPKTDLADTLSYTQNSSKISFKSACSWTDTFDSFEDDGSQTPLSRNVPLKTLSHLFPNRHAAPVEAFDRQDPPEVTALVPSVVKPSTLELK